MSLTPHSARLRLAVTGVSQHSFEFGGTIDLRPSVPEGCLLTPNRGRQRPASSVLACSPWKLWERFHPGVQEPLRNSRHARAFPTRAPRHLLSAEFPRFFQAYGLIIWGSRTTTICAAWPTTDFPSSDFPAS